MECVPREQKNSVKPKSTFQDEKLYIQPAKRRPLAYNKPFKKPTIKIDFETTYGTSYGPYKFDPRSKLINYGVHEKVAAIKPGKFDFDTTYKLSYQLLSKLTKTKMFVPKSCLSMNGSHDMKTTHMLSYAQPGYSRAIICEPYRGKVCNPVSMDCNTVTKESYQGFGGFVKVWRPTKRDVWRTKFRNDYLTTSRLSYQYKGPALKRTRVGHRRPIVSAKIDRDTVYSTSYQAPGRFVDRDNVDEICMR